MPRFGINLPGPFWLSFGGRRRRRTSSRSTRVVYVSQTRQQKKWAADAVKWMANAQQQLSVLSARAERAEAESRRLKALLDAARNDRLGWGAPARSE